MTGNYHAGNNQAIKSNHTFTIGITLVTILILSISSFYLQRHFLQHQTELVKHTLSTILDNTHSAINRWVDTQKAEVIHWANSPDVMEIGNKLTKLKNLDNKSLSNSPYQKHLRDHMQSLLATGRYAGYFIVDHNDINLASSRDTNLGKINLLHGKDNFLDKIRSGSTLISPITFSEVPLTNPQGILQDNLPSMFVGTPLLDKTGNITAIFLLRIDPELEFSSVFRRNNISKSIEAYAFNKDAIMISASRFDEQLQKAGLLKPNQSSILNIKLLQPANNSYAPRTPGSTTASNTLTWAAQQALSGNTGTDTTGYIDYRGIQVTGSWLWDENLGFGIIVEQDASEAYEVHNHVIFAIQILTVIGVGMLIVVATISITSKNRLAKSEQQKRGILNTVLDAVITTDDSGAILSFNKAAETLFGYSQDEITGKSVDTLMPDTYKQPHADHISNYINSQDNASIGSIRQHLFGKKKNGDIFPLEISLNELILDNKLTFVGVLRDISARLQQESTLKEERDKAKYYLDTVEVIVLMLDEHANIELINRKGCELLGYSEAELLGKNIIDTLIPEQKRPATHIFFNKSINAEINTNFNYENKIITKNGDILDVVWKSAYIKNPDGKIHKILSSGIDITQSKQLQQELKQQQLLFESVFDDIPDALIITDEAHRIVRANHSFTRIFGYTNLEVYNQPINTLLVASESKELFNSIDDLSQPTCLIPVTVNYHHKDSYDFPGETVSAPWRDITGNIKGYISVIRDISDRVKAEQKLLEHEITLQSALDAVSAGAFSYDLSSKMILWDRRSCEIFGQQLHNGIGELNDWINSIHHDNLIAVTSSLKRTIESGDHFDISYTINHPSGEMRHVHSRGIVIRDNNNQALCIKGLNIDDTVEFNTNNEKNDLRKQLVQAQKMESIGQLTGGIAHDFNNMLSSILGFTQLSRKRLSNNIEFHDDKLKSYLDQILLASERARDLVKQMLAFSRNESGDITTIDLDLIVEEVANMLRPILPSSIDFVIDTDTQDHKINCDAVQLHQVLMNLCINARDAMSGAGTISLITRIMHPREENCTSCHHTITGDYISLIVSDTGSGIPEELVSKIFEPFVTTKEVGKGTGMGLAMVHGIIHQHQGHIIVDSTPGEGTSFTLLLPVVTEESSHETSNTTIASTEETENNTTTKHIMIVDDEISLTRLFSDLLHDHNYKVTSFTDSQEALQEFQANPDKYDCLITDQTMPKLTGIELVKKISSIRKDLPIIMQTGYSDQINDDTIKHTGITRLLKKPVNIDDVILTINQVLEQHEHNHSES